MTKLDLDLITGESLSQFDFVAIVGPTASGKTEASFKVAALCPVEIISCDSVQVYRGFDIGSAKATKEEREKIPHHLIDVVDPDESFDAGRFVKLATEAIKDIRSRGKLPLVVGGTGLYLRALLGLDFAEKLPKSEELRKDLIHISKEDLLTELKQCDPERAAELHPNDRLRIERAVEIYRLTGKTLKENMTEDFQKRGQDLKFNYGVLYLLPERSLLHEKVAIRSRKMVDVGLIDEVKTLLDNGVDPESKPMQSIGYKQVVEYLREGFSKEDLIERIVIATRQYAKRQITWFNKYL